MRRSKQSSLPRAQNWARNVSEAPQLWWAGSRQMVPSKACLWRLVLMRKHCGPAAELGSVAGAVNDETMLLPSSSDTRANYQKSDQFNSRRAVMARSRIRAIDNILKRDGDGDHTC